MFGNTPSSQINNSYCVGASLNCVGRMDSGPGYNPIDDTRKVNQISYFYDSSNPPMNNWDFNNVWQANIGGYPTLRGD